jgi:hypothetical protein
VFAANELAARAKGESIRNAFFMAIIYTFEGFFSNAV